MKDIRIEKLAKNLLEHSVNLQKDENILIEILGEDAIPLGKDFILSSLIGINSLNTEPYLVVNVT